MEKKNLQKNNPDSEISQSEERSQNTKVLPEDNAAATSMIVDEFDSAPLNIKISDKLVNSKQSGSLPAADDKDTSAAPSAEQHDDTLTITLSDEVMDRLPGGFSVDEIGKIDLSEAEKIANEDIHFLTETDLFDELEDLELSQLISADDSENSASSEISENHPAEPAPPSASAAKEISALPESDEVKESPDIEPDHVPQESTDETDFIVSPHSETASDTEVPSSKDENAETSDALADEISGAFEEVALSAETDTPDLSAEEETEPETADAAADKDSSDENISEHDEYVIEDPALDFEPIEEELVSAEPSDDENSDFEYDESMSAVSRITDEVIPDEIRAIERIADNVAFIDDSVSSDESGDELHDRLTELRFDLVETEEGDTLYLSESEALASDYKNLAAKYYEAPDEILKQEAEFESFKPEVQADNELDFIDAAFFSDDYGRYMLEIDDLYVLEERKEITSAVEILGLNYGEIDFIEERMFHDDLEEADLNGIFNLIDYDNKFIHDRGESSHCNYMLPHEGSLLLDEKRSIEEDISSAGALIFEEDVEDIRRILGHDVRPVKKAPVEESDAVYDITDRIVIIDDEMDVDRFVKEFPDEKQVDLKKLLNYLDGLFEKLPEDVVKKFADSEYFDMYVNVLNKIGV